MNANLYFAGILIIVFLVFALLALLIWALNKGFSHLNVGIEKRKKLLFNIGLAFIFWLAILSILSLRGFFSDFSVLPPKILLAILPPLLLSILLLFSKIFSILLKVIPLQWLVLVQSFRIIMEIFLWMGWKGGYVPPQMTFEWLNFDITVGLSAPFAAAVFFGKRRVFKQAAILWNVFGLILLVNIFFIAITSMPSPLRIFLNEPSNVFVAEFPFIWIPGFIVPFALAMHFFSLKQLLQMKE